MLSVARFYLEGAVKIVLIVFQASITTDPDEGNDINEEPIRGMSAHIAQLEIILGNQVKETQYLRRMIENFHFADKQGVWRAPLNRL